MLGLLSTPEHSSGDSAIDGLLSKPWAIVYSVCTAPQSHDFFLVPLVSVTPFSAKVYTCGEYLEEDVAKMATRLSVKFNDDYGAVAKGLFSLLYSKGVLKKDGDDAW